MKIKKIIKLIVPPILFEILVKFRNTFSYKNSKKIIRTDAPNEQDLDPYWDPKMADLLENWGRDHVWNEIQMFLTNCKGKILDIACGTGITIEIMLKYNNLDIHGCDISDYLINRALKRGINKNNLKVCDATNMDIYTNDLFNYSYSIGSLEHFTEEGILKFISECHRITKFSSMHMLPVSRSENNEGWLKTVQSFHNNSVQWWLEKFKSKYFTIHVIDSGWSDDISFGKWFICIKNDKELQIDNKIPND